MHVVNSSLKFGGELQNLKDVKVKSSFLFD